MRTRLRLLVTLVVVALAALAGLWLWYAYLYTPWTRDGRVRAEIITLASEVSGPVETLWVADGQAVVAGEPLFRIDPSRYRRLVEGAEATLERRRAELELRRHEAERRDRLGPGVISAEHLEAARIDRRVAAAALAQAESDLARARLDLAHTTITAPVAGHVLNLRLAGGNHVTAGTPVMALVRDDSWYVTGYFEETKLPKITVGDPARVHLMSGDITLSGRVAAIGRGIADPNTTPDEQLLPRVQPTFSWVRLAQRIPVHIALDTLPEGLPLSVGMTASVRILDAAAD